MSTWSDLREKILSSTPIKDKTGIINKYDTFATDLYKDDYGRLYTKHNLTDGIRIFTKITDISPINLSPIDLSAGSLSNMYISKSNFYLNDDIINAFVNNYSYGGYLTRKQLIGRINSLNSLSSIIPQSFLNEIVDIAGKNNVPPALFMFIALSESSFRDAPGGVYGGYFGQARSSGGGYGASLKTQAELLLPKTFHRLVKENPGISLNDAIGLTYVAHHLPSIGFHIYKETGGHPWSNDPNVLPAQLSSIYHKYVKTKKEPYTLSRQAETILINLYAAYAAGFIVSDPFLKKYLSVPK